MTRSNQQHKRKRSLLWFVVLAAIAGLVSSYLPIDKLKILEFDFVATILGVLLGFGLTIYTFMIQLTQPIIDKLGSHIVDKAKRRPMELRLKSAEKELREDLEVIFFCLVAVLIVGVIGKSVDLTFNIGLHHVAYLPEWLYTFAYLLAFLAMYDLMRSLFYMGEIAISLLTAEPAEAPDDEKKGTAN